MATLHRLPDAVTASYSSRARRRCCSPCPDGAARRCRAGGGTARPPAVSACSCSAPRTDVTPGDLEGDLDDLRAARAAGDDRPSRPEAIDAVAACRRAGVRVLMVTGDHPRTARAIGVALGLPDRPAVTGVGARAARTTRRCASGSAPPTSSRAWRPSTSCALVRALQADGEVVGDDRRRRQRRAGAAPGRHRRGDGPRRDRGRARRPPTWCWPTTTSRPFAPRSRRAAASTTTSSRR